MKVEPVASHPGNERLLPENDLERRLMKFAIWGAIPHRARLLISEQPEAHHRLRASVVLSLTDEWNGDGEAKAIGRGDLEYSSTGHRVDGRWRLTSPAVLWFSLARKADGSLVAMRRMESTGSPSAMPEGFLEGRRG